MLGFILIIGLLCTIIMFPWAKLAEESGQVGLFWYFKRDWNPRYTLLANLLESDSCKRLLPEGSETFCERDTWGFYVGGLIVLCCYGAAICLEAIGLISLVNIVAKGTKYKYCKYLVSHLIPVCSEIQLYTDIWTNVVLAV